MDRPWWHEETGRTFTAEAGIFILKVHRTPDPEHVRFIVLKSDGADGHVLVGSGTRSDLGTAMTAAERMADRLCAVSGMAPACAPEWGPLVRPVASASAGGVRYSAAYTAPISRWRRLSVPSRKSRM
jgi:hypothetical protein